MDREKLNKIIMSWRLGALIDGFNVVWGSYLLLTGKRYGILNILVATGCAYARFKMGIYKLKR